MMMMSVMNVNEKNYYDYHFSVPSCSGNKKSTGSTLIDQSIDRLLQQQPAANFYQIKIYSTSPLENIQSPGMQRQQQQVGREFTTNDIDDNCMVVVRNQSFSLYWPCMECCFATKDAMSLLLSLVIGARIGHRRCRRRRVVVVNRFKGLFGFGLLG